jgi:hypothetical protein
VISTRYVPGVAVLVTIALVPTIVHSYVGASVDDGRKTAAIPTRLNGLDGRSTNRPSIWAEETFASTDFIERRYGVDVTLFIGRSYDAKRLYHHPELAIAYGRTFESTTVVRSAKRNDVPLHILSGSGGIGAYALLYGAEFIDDPIRFQFKNALALLVRPRQMTTLFFTHSPRTYPTERVAESPAAGVLLSAIESFSTQLPASSR